MADDSRPPASAWYDLVMEQIAIRGWSLSELAQRARIGRPTIYGWRDNPRKPQARSVNAAADALGIPRERALRLAGVIAGAGDRSPPASEPTPLDELLGAEGAEEVRRKIRARKGAGAEWYISAVEDALSRPPANADDPPGPGARRAGR